MVNRNIDIVDINSKAAFNKLLLMLHFKATMEKLLKINVDRYDMTLRNGNIVK